MNHLQSKSEPPPNANGTQLVMASAYTKAPATLRKHYVIFRLNGRGLEFVPYTPRVDGTRVIFGTRADTEDWVYDYQLVGRNDRVEYREHELPDDIRESAVVYHRPRRGHVLGQCQTDTGESVTVRTLPDGTLAI